MLEFAPQHRVNFAERHFDTQICQAGHAMTWIGKLLLKIPALWIVALALLGAPLFAVMGGASELLWLTHHDPTQQFLRRIAPNVMEERFADSPILVTIPLFAFVGYMMAESKAPDRIVRAASAVFGWLPGGLAMVCIMASVSRCLNRAATSSGVRFGPIVH